MRRASCFGDVLRTSSAFTSPVEILTESLIKSREPSAVPLIIETYRVSLLLDILQLWVSDARSVLSYTELFLKRGP